MKILDIILHWLIAVCFQRTIIYNPMIWWWVSVILKQFLYHLLTFLLTPQFGYNKNKSVNTSIIFISGKAFLSDSKIKSLADVFIKFWDCFSFGPYVELKKEHVIHLKENWNWRQIISNMLLRKDWIPQPSPAQHSNFMVATMQARWMFCEYFILKDKKRVICNDSNNWKS